MACKRGLYSKSYCFFETLAERFKNYKLIKYSKIFSGTLIFFHCFLSYFKQILDSYFFSIQLNSVHNVSLATRFGGEQEHRRDFPANFVVYYEDGNTSKYGHFLIRILMYMESGASAFSHV